MVQILKPIAEPALDGEAARACPSRPVPSPASPLPLPSPSLPSPPPSPLHGLPHFCSLRYASLPPFLQHRLGCTAGISELLDLYLYYILSHFCPNAENAPNSGLAALDSVVMSTELRSEHRFRYCCP